MGVTSLGFPLGAKSVSGIPHMVTAYSEILKILGVFSPPYVFIIYWPKVCVNTKQKGGCFAHPPNLVVKLFYCDFKINCVI